MSTSDFWRGKRVLVTGHTGFKGGWLTLWLQHLGAHVTGISLPPITTPNLFELAEVAKNTQSYFCDIRDADKLVTLVRTTRPEVVFHLAAQPLVRASYRDPMGTYSSNVMGTVNLLESLRGLDSVRVAVMVTTDKVYRNVESLYPFREIDPLGGHDPYSASKASSEIIIASYRDAFLADQGVAVASARAGNVIGGGDWSDDRLIPDAVRAWQLEQILHIRQPQAVRPWQHVLEPLHGYLRLAANLWSQPSLAGAFNFGPLPNETATVREVINLARQAYGAGDISYHDDGGPHETNWLALETSKARVALGISPKWDLKESLSRTMTWYRNQHNGHDARHLSLSEIIEYEITL